MQWLKSWCEAVVLVYKAESLKPTLWKIFEHCLIQKLIFSTTDSIGGVEIAVPSERKSYCINFTNGMELLTGWAEKQSLAREGLRL